MLNKSEEFITISGEINKICRDCNIEITDETKSKNVRFCKFCNIITCTELLSHLNDKIIFDLQVNNFIPILSDNISEKIYDEIKYVMYDKSEFYEKGNKGANGNLIEGFIDFIIHIFILNHTRRPNICFINMIPIETIQDYEVVKNELNEIQHNDHVKQLYDFFQKIHNDYRIIETQKTVKLKNFSGNIDIVCEKCLIDIKAVKKMYPSLMRKQFLQLIIYYCIYGNKNIEKLGIYDYYRGYIYWINTEIIDVIKIIELMQNLK
jgi:hypothetical protein